jgi:hypothetical protein
MRHTTHNAEKEDSTMKTLKGASTRLEKKVQAMVNGYAKGYEDGVNGFMEDLVRSGCRSGMVSGLIYYTDTVKFYKTYRKDITALLVETMEDTGYTDPIAIFGDKWDKADPFADDTENQNLLALFAFEETAMRLAENNGVEL